MRILAIADRPPKRKIKEIISEQKIDLIITLGDLDQSDIRELEDITHIPKIGVYGNHDSGMYFEPLGIKNMHLETYEQDGIVFGGFQGCVRYKENPDAIMCTQDEATELMKDFPRVDVFLAHCPPYRINDEPDELAHQGFRALREYVEIHAPAYLFHGHTYPTEENIVRKFAGTKIEYVFEERVLEIDITR